MFIDEDEVGVNYPQDDALVLTLEIGLTMVRKALVHTSEV